MPKPFQGYSQVAPDPGERNERQRGLSGASVESVAPKKRRKFPPAERARLLKAADAAVASGRPGALQELLRKEGIYSSHISTWRKQGLIAHKPGRKSMLDAKDRQLLALTKRTAQLERKLQIANALLDLQKKAHAILGIALPDSDEET